jgi:hypothetical protein
LSALNHTRPEAFDEHVGFPRQRAQHGAPGFGFEIEPRLALAAVDHPVEDAGAAGDAIARRLQHRAGGVAGTGRFDLQHVRAQFG